MNMMEMLDMNEQDRVWAMTVGYMSCNRGYFSFPMKATSIREDVENFCLPWNGEEVEPVIDNVINNLMLEGHIEF